MGLVRITPIGRCCSLLLAASLGGFPCARSKVETAAAARAVPWRRVPPAQPPAAAPRRAQAETSPPDRPQRHAVDHDRRRTLDYVANVPAGSTSSTRAARRGASLFYSAYILAAPATTGRGPIIFAFNGGPGAASVYLHLGAMGPRRAQIGPAGRRGHPASLVATPNLARPRRPGVRRSGRHRLSRATLADAVLANQAFWETDADIDAMYRSSSPMSPVCGDRADYLVGRAMAASVRRARRQPVEARHLRLAGVVLISPAIDRGADWRTTDDAARRDAARADFAASPVSNDRVPGVAADRAARDRFLADARSGRFGEGLRTSSPAMRWAGRAAQAVPSRPMCTFTGLTPELAAQRDGRPLAS